MIDIHRWGAVGATSILLHCGADASSTLLVSEQTPERTSGHFTAEEREIEFSSQRTGPLAGDVQLHVGALSYDVHYDYGARRVSADGYGGAIDRATQRALLGAINGLGEYLGPAQPGSALHEQMLVASLSLLRDSGGMQLDSKTFDLGEPALASAEDAAVQKSLEDDGIACIQSGEWYAVSFDVLDTTIVDEPVQAGSANCNGQCGPSCVQITPWRMWTLDCLEHDTCCSVTDGDAVCWTPLGECGDEYDAASRDFLRGYEPFRRHCGG